MPDSREHAYLAAAQAYCEYRFPYGRYAEPDGREKHLQRDVEITAAEPWLRALVDAVLDRFTTAMGAVTAEEAAANLLANFRLPETL